MQSQQKWQFLKTAESPHVLQVCLRPPWFLSWIFSQALPDSAWKGMCILLTAVLKPYSIKSFPRALTSILLNIPPTLRNDYLIQRVISSWSYYSHPPWQSREKNTQLWSIRESRFKTSPFIEINANLFRSPCNKTKWYRLVNSNSLLLQWAFTRTHRRSQWRTHSLNWGKKSRWQLMQTWFKC